MTAASVPTWNTEMIELAPGVSAYVQAGGGFCVANAGLIAGRDGTTAIDALFVPRMTRAFLDEAARASASPIDRLVNTHHHVDHTYGNHAFAGKTIIAHDLTRAEMQRVGNPGARIVAMAPQFAEDLAQPVPITLPTLTYSDRLTLYVDDREVQLLHVPTAHTIDDTLVYLPEEKILFAGDIGFFYVTPLAFEGSILGWIEAIRRVEAMDVERIVPGHGPLGDKQHMVLLRGYFEHLRDESRRRFDAGMPAPAAVLDIDLGPYRAWAEPERIAANVLRLYEDLSDAEWQPLDLAALGRLQRLWLEKNG